MSSEDIYRACPLDTDGDVTRIEKSCDERYKYMAATIVLASFVNKLSYATDTGIPARREGTSGHRHLLPPRALSTRHLLLTEAG